VRAIMTPKLAWLGLLTACGSGAWPGSNEMGTDASAALSDGLSESRCSGDTTITCTHETIELLGRTVTYQVPLGTAPAAGRRMAERRLLSRLVHPG
jgi:hypothetical protein